MSNTGSVYSEKVVSDYQKEIKILTGVNKKHLEKMNILEKSRSGIHQNKLLKEIEDLKKENEKITSHRDRLLRFHKRNTKKIKEMEIEIKNWKITIEKKSNENTDLRFLNSRLYKYRLLKEENENLKKELDYDLDKGIYDDDDVDYYVDAGRRVVLKDGREMDSKD